MCFCRCRGVRGGYVCVRSALGQDTEAVVGRVDAGWALPFDLSDVAGGLVGVGHWGLVDRIVPYG